MVRDIIDINDFTILVEEAYSEQPIIDACSFEEPMIAVAFYGSGNVHLEMSYKDKKHEFDNTKGLALAFYADEKVEAKHHVSPDKPLQCLVIATALRNLDKFPAHEAELFKELLHQLVNPADHYVEGPKFLMTPEMTEIVQKVFEHKFEGRAKMMFFRSYMTALLAHFFGQLSVSQEQQFSDQERKKLFQAKEILHSNLETPPSLSELSKMIGLNTFKLKNRFKELFGVPVFKYLQNERLNKAYELIQGKEVSVQEAAWQVGYDSLSSFSNAFSKKFGFRPSAIK